MGLREDKIAAEKAKVAALRKKAGIVPKNQPAPTPAPAPAAPPKTGDPSKAGKDVVPPTRKVTTKKQPQLPSGKTSLPTETKETIIGRVLREQQQKQQETATGGKTFDESQFFQAFEFEGRQFRFNPDSGQLEDIGEVRGGGKDTQGNLTDQGTVFGVDAQGRKRAIGNITPDRAGIQGNVATGANEGGTQTPEDIFADLKASADAGGRPARSIFDLQPLEGAITGQEKLERLGFVREMRGGIGGVSEGRTKTVSELTDLDFAGQVKSANAANAPKQGRGEDPRDFRIRLLEFELGNVNTAFNSVRSGVEKKQLKLALDRQKEAFAGLGFKAKSKNQLESEAKLNPDINRVINERKTHLTSTINARRDLEIERQTQLLGARGNPKTIEFLTKSIIDRENARAKADITKGLAAIKKDEKAFRDDFVQKGLVNEETILGRVKELKGLSGKELAAKRVEQEKQAIVEEYLGKINPKTGELFTQLEANAQAAKVIAAIGKDTTTQDAFGRFSDTIASGQIDTTNLAAIFDAARNEVGGDNVKALKLVTSLASADVAKAAQNEFLLSQGFSSEVIQDSNNDRTIGQIIQSVIQGDELSFDESAILDEYEITHPERAARWKLKITNPELSESEIFKQVKQQFSTKGATSTGSGAGGSTVKRSKKDEFKEARFQARSSLEAGTITPDTAEAFLIENFDLSGVDRAALLRGLVKFDRSSQKRIGPEQTFEFIDGVLTPIEGGEPAGEENSELDEIFN